MLVLYIYVHSKISNRTLSLASLRSLTLATQQNTLQLLCAWSNTACTVRDHEVACSDVSCTVRDHEVACSDVSCTVREHEVTWSYVE